MRNLLVRLLDQSELETQHGVASVRTTEGLTKIGFTVDRPEVLNEICPETLADMVEQINDHGHVIESLKIATHGMRRNFDFV